MDFWISPTGKFVMNLLRILNAFFFHPFSAKQMAYKTAHFALRIPIILLLLMHLSFILYRHFFHNNKRGDIAFLECINTFASK